MAGLAGTVRWAVVPYTPSAPFTIQTQEGPISDLRYEELRTLATAGTSLQFVTEGKLRPVLILSDPVDDRAQDVTALRLARFSKLSEAEQQAIREHRDPLHFHLPSDRFALSQENAAMVHAMVRVHVSAIGPEAPAGTLNVEEQRVLGERIIRYYRFNTALLVKQELQRLARVQQARQSDA